MISQTQSHKRMSAFTPPQAARLALAALMSSAPLAAAPPPLELPAPQPAPSPPQAPLELPPAATPTPTPSPTPPPSPPAAQPSPAATPDAADALRALAPSPAPVDEAAAAPEPAESEEADETPLLPPENEPLPQAPSSAVGDSVWPAWWPWAAGALAGLGALLAALVLLRRRQPKVLQLAAPAKSAAAGATGSADAVPARLDCQLDILSASRSLMMFTIEYRLEIANRSTRAVRDLQVTTRLGYPGRTGEEAALAPGAEHGEILPRIGPHQSRSVTGTLRLPLSEIAPIRQGASPLLIPLIHLILEGAGYPRETRVFVAGTPSPANLGRLQPIRLDTTPGGIAGVRALPVNAP